jgi:hypothetical protein
MLLQEDNTDTQIEYMVSAIIAPPLAQNMDNSGLAGNICRKTLLQTRPALQEIVSVYFWQSERYA